MFYAHLSTSHLSIHRSIAFKRVYKPPTVSIELLWLNGVKKGYVVVYSTFGFYGCCFMYLCSDCQLCSHNKCFTTYKIHTLSFSFPLPLSLSISISFVFFFRCMRACAQCPCTDCRRIIYQIAPPLYCLTHNKMQILDTNHLKLIFFSLSFPFIRTQIILIDDDCKRCHLMWSCQAPFNVD